MYRVSHYGVGIEKVEVVKETEKCICLQDFTWDTPPTPRPGKSHRELKTDRNRFFDTFESTKTELIEMCKNTIIRNERNLTMAKNQLAKAENLTEFTP
jgi:hypothetical protein